MIRKGYKKLTGLVALGMAFIVVLGGCGQSGRADKESAGAADTVVQNGNDSNLTRSTGTDAADNTDSGLTSSESPAGSDTGESDVSAMDLKVCFGDDGIPFMLHLYENDTAAAIAGYVGTSDWRLPIYERDDSADYEVMQYYDIPGRYDIPSNPVKVTSEKAGEVYYSDPNRIVLFYHDAEIEGDYTLIGYFDVTDEFVTAVEENPVLEGWGNKIVHIAQP